MDIEYPPRKIRVDITTPNSLLKNNIFNGTDTLADIKTLVAQKHDHTIIKSIKLYSNSEERTEQYQIQDYDLTTIEQVSQKYGEEKFKKSKKGYLKLGAISTETVIKPVVEKKDNKRTWSTDLLSNRPIKENKFDVIGKPVPGEVHEVTQRKQCLRPAKGMCKYCTLWEDRSNTDWQISFDEQLKKIRAEECKGKCRLIDRCISCTLDFEKSYKTPPKCPTCTNGICVKCSPKNYQAKEQKYTHVDHVTYLNSEILTYWNTSCVHSGGKRRIGWLYGYFCKDPEFKDGVRAVIEAIYEAPHTESVVDLPEFLESDEELAQKEKIASGYGQSRIGWTFTKDQKEDDPPMSPIEILTTSRQQNKHLYEHPCGYKVPKFITIVRTN